MADSLDPRTAKAILSSTALTLLLMGLMSCPPATAAEAAAKQSQAAEEQPPTPEPPYPGAEETQFAADPTLAPSPTPTESNEASEAAIANSPMPASIEKPIKMEEDGSYIYNKTLTIEPSSPRSPYLTPKNIRASGEYVYDTRLETPKAEAVPEIEKPTTILQNGEFLYDLPLEKSNRIASFRASAITPPSVRNANNGLTFGDIYGKNVAPGITADYEIFRLFSSVGRLGIKFGSGLIVSSGQGHFKDPSRATEQPEERFTFFLMPNTLTANYRFQYFESQLIVPFVEGGGGYYTCIEMRDDNRRPRLAGAPVVLGAGGVNFLLDHLDRRSMKELNNQYGINHVWLTLEARATVGLYQDLDYTSTSGGAGFIVEF